MRFILEFVDDETGRGSSAKDTIECEFPMPYPDVDEEFTTPTGLKAEVMERLFWFSAESIKVQIRYAEISDF